jgi:lysozyme
LILSSKGLSALKLREGSENRAYKDTKGIWTIGVGHTGPEVKQGLVWSDDKVNSEFIKDVQWAVDAVNQTVVPLNQNMFDALVSFTFNVGSHAFLTSTMKKLLDQGLYKDAADQFDRWNKPPEIVARRSGEKQQFLLPV